jgi:hypothetical protein
MVVEHIYLTDLLGLSILAGGIAGVSGYFFAFGLGAV